MLEVWRLMYFHWSYGVTVANSMEVKGKIILEYIP
jgi:hypothetical protein